MEKTLAALRNLFKADIRCMRRMGAASLDLSWLACGRFDAYFEYTLSAWDFAAGLMIVKEGGGAVSAIDGTPADLMSRGLICSNGFIHEDLLECVLETGRFE
jgi:myo-inositol-1(or 4)-monophosphatase